jgi:hypothetical protein
MKNKLNKKTKIFFVLSVFFSFFFLFTTNSLASTEIYFQREEKEILVGEKFQVNLNISSPETSVNVIDGTITYDKNKIEIEKVEMTNSILSLWVKEPVFNNETGELSFSGGIPNGFIGKDGKVIEIFFTAKKEGETRIGFKDIFSVFANDGSGTEISPWLKPMLVFINKGPEYVFINSLYNLIGDYQYYILISLLIVISILIKFKNKKK